MLQALELLQSAISLLDQAQTPAHIGAHVDLAANELELVIAESQRVSSAAQIDTNADPQ